MLIILSALKCENGSFPLDDNVTYMKYDLLLVMLELVHSIEPQYTIISAYMLDNRISTKQIIYEPQSTISIYSLA